MRYRTPASQTSMSNDRHPGRRCRTRRHAVACRHELLWRRSGDCMRVRHTSIAILGLERKLRTARRWANSAAFVHVELQWIGRSITDAYVAIARRLQPMLLHHRRYQSGSLRVARERRYGMYARIGYRAPRPPHDRRARLTSASSACHDPPVPTGGTAPGNEEHLIPSLPCRGGSRMSGPSSPSGIFVVPAVGMRPSESPHRSTSRRTTRTVSGTSSCRTSATSDALRRHRPPR